MHSSWLSRRYHTRVMLCPRCQYDLAGLPAEYTCPECGLRYDSRTTAIICRGRRNQYYAAAVGAANLLVLIFWGTRVAVPALLIIGITVLFILVISWRLGRAQRWPHRIILNPEGVRFEPPDSPPSIYPWEKVCRAEYSWTDGRLRILGPDGNEVVGWGYRVLGSGRMAKRLANEITTLAEHYSAVSPPTPPNSKLLVQEH